MTTPYDYTPPAPSPWATQLPLLLLALAGCVYLGAQLTALDQGAKTMRWQLQTLDKQIENVKSAQKQADDMAAKMADPVKQASQIQTQYSALFNDVFELAKDDEDVKKIIAKWKIQRNQNQAPDSGSSNDQKKEGMTLGK